MNRYIHSFCFPFCSFISIPFYLCLCIPFLSLKIFGMLHGVWDLRPQPEIEAVHFAMEAQSLNHWTTKEVLSQKKKKKKFCLCISQCILMCFPLVHVHLYQHSICLFLFPSPPNYLSWIMRKHPFVSSGNIFSKGKMYGKGIHSQRGQVQLSLCLTSTTPPPPTKCQAFYVYLAKMDWTQHQ